MGSQRVRHDWATSFSLFTFMHWTRKWQPTPVFLPGESQGWGSLVHCRLWVTQSQTRLKRLSNSSSSSRQHIKNQRHYFVNKGYGFSSGHVWMWELDYKESWAPANWCFWIGELEKILESPLDCKEIQPVHPKGDQSWVFIGRIDVEAETPVLWLPHTKSWFIWKDPDVGKDWRQEENETTEDEMVRWPHQLNGHEFGWTPGVDKQGGLACCGSWGRKKSDTTEQLNWTNDGQPHIRYIFFEV